MVSDIHICTLSYDDSTIGRLWTNGFQCFTLELPWLDNQRNISCIPPGVYQYRYKRSNRNGDVLELDTVIGRTYIQIHAGNFTNQIEGCILVGRSITFLDDDSIPDVTNSRDTMSRLLRAAPARGIITVERYG